MRFYKTPEHPLRVYMQEDIPGEMQKLQISLNNKYAPPENSYLTNMEDELTSILFLDEDINKYYIVHGLINVILKEAESVGIVCNNEVSSEIIDKEYPTIDENLLEGITLRDYQLEGISSAIANKRGIVQVHTGGGKTEMMTGVTRYLLDSSDMNILVCVPTTNLLYQTYERMLKRGISDSDISLLGDGNRLDPNKRVLISTVQSAYKRLDCYDDYMSWLSNTRCLMLDEAHHSKCRTWSTLIDRVAPEYLLGFSAEPFHRDKDHTISDLVLRGIIGPVIHRVTMDYLVEKGFLSKPYVLALDSTYSGNIYKVIDWHTVNKNGIVNNKNRNRMIEDIAISLINHGRKPLILVNQIAHGKELAKAISKVGNVIMMTGGMKVTSFSGGMVVDSYVDNDNQVIKDFNEGKIDALIGTSTLDEGVDIPSLSAVILAGGGKSRLKNLQRIGRSLRSKSGLNVSYVIDFRDRFNIVTQAHFKRRKSSYDEMGMPVYYISDKDSIGDVIDSIERERSAELGLI